MFKKILILASFCVVTYLASVIVFSANSQVENVKLCLIKLNDADQYCHQVITRATEISVLNIELQERINEIDEENQKLRRIVIQLQLQLLRKQVCQVK